MKHYKQKEL